VTDSEEDKMLPGLGIKTEEGSLGGKRMKHLLLITAAAFVWCSLGACTFLRADLVQPLQPLKEKVIEGEGRTKILLLDVSGFLSEKERSGGLLGREQPSPVSQVREALRKAEKDDEIRGIIVRINSPGGTVTASDIIHHEILTYRERTKVPVTACIMGIGASGGYYAAVAADRIYAHPTSVVGSIGVLAVKLNVAGLLSKIGVSEETVKSGDKKDMMSPFRDATPEERRILQSIIDGMQERFLDAVRAGRGDRLGRKELDSLADGRIFTAQQALEAKLIDRIGYLDDAIAGMKKDLGVDQARIITYYRPGGYRGSIYAGLPDGGSNLSGFGLLESAGPDLLPSTEFLYLWQR
jgi:protease-4